MSVERDVDPGESTIELTVATSALSSDVLAAGAAGKNGQLGTNGHLGTNGQLSNGQRGTNGARLAAVEDLRSVAPLTEPVSTAEPVSAVPGSAVPVSAEPAAAEPVAHEPAAADETAFADDAAGRSSADAWDLVRRTQEGDADAFGLLYDRYVDTVYRFVYYRLGDRTQAEDLTSETFLRALRRISTVHEQGRDIGAWLVTIARNLVLDHVKSAQYRLCVPTEEIVEAHLEQAGDTTEAAALAAIDQHALLEAVKLLSPEQQESIVLRFFQGLSLAETAEVMGRNAGAVKALQHRAMQRLHLLLTSPTPKPPATTADQLPERQLPRRHSARAPPPAEDPTSVRKRYRTRNRRNH